MPLNKDTKPSKEQIKRADKKKKSFTLEGTVEFLGSLKYFY